MSRKATLLLISLFCSGLANAQTLFERLVDSAMIEKRHEMLLSKTDSPQNFIVCEMNWVETDPDSSFIVIDTNKFSKKYFVQGRFLEDWIEWKEREQVPVDDRFTREMFLFDTVNEKSYYFYEFEGIIEHHFSKDDYLCKLFESKTVDFVFYYPTFVHHHDSSSPYYEGLPNDFMEIRCCFALKGDQFFYIDAFKEKIYPLEEVMESHWDWITNVKE